MEMLILLPLFLGVGYIVVTIYVILSIINNPELDSNNKLFWIAMILFFNILGLIVYLIVKDKNVIK